MAETNKEKKTRLVKQIMEMLQTRAPFNETISEELFWQTVEDQKNNRVTGEITPDERA